MRREDPPGIALFVCLHGEWALRNARREVHRRTKGESERLEAWKVLEGDGGSPSVSASARALSKKYASSGVTWVIPDDEPCPCQFNYDDPDL